MTDSADTPLSLAWELIGACDEYHRALDHLFAITIGFTTSTGGEVWLPSKSGQPWAAAVAGNALRERARRLLPRLDAEAIEAAPVLADKKALVLYFETDADRDEMVELMRPIYKGMRTVRL